MPPPAAANTTLDDASSFIYRKKMISPKSHTGRVILITVGVCAGIFVLFWVMVWCNDCLDSRRSRKSKKKANSKMEEESKPTLSGYGLGPGAGTLRNEVELTGRAAST